MKKLATIVAGILALTAVQAKDHSGIVSTTLGGDKNSFLYLDESDCFRGPEREIPRPAMPGFPRRPRPQQQQQQ